MFKGTTSNNYRSLVGERELHQRSKSDSGIHNHFRLDPQEQQPQQQNRRRQQQQQQHRQQPANDNDDGNNNNNRKTPFAFLDRIKRFLRSTENLHVAVGRTPSSVRQVQSQRTPQQRQQRQRQQQLQRQHNNNNNNSNSGNDDDNNITGTVGRGRLKNPLDLIRSFKTSRSTSANRRQSDNSVSDDPTRNAAPANRHHNHHHHRHNHNNLNDQKRNSHNREFFSDDLRRLSIFDPHSRTFAVVGSQRKNLQPRKTKPGLSERDRFRTPKSKPCFTDWDGLQDTLVLGGPGVENPRDFHALAKRGRRRSGRLRNPRVRRRLSFGFAADDGWNGADRIGARLDDLPVAV